MGYVATQPLPWGDETIAAGAPVPADESGRDYASLLYLGQIREVDDTVNLSDDEVRAELKKVTAERDALQEQVDGAADEVIEPIVIPDGVVPGETPGWPVVVLPLTDEQRELLAEAEISGTVPLDELRETLSVLGEAKAEETTGDGVAANDASDGLPEGVRALGGGWFELADGSRVQGRRALDEALAGS